jgi:uncharacterized protein YcsI (UPF0317 family)
LPELIGIKDLARPDYGDPVEVRTDELPVFWACGVTPQSVIAHIKPPLAITHAPGAMLITDLKNRQFAVIKEYHSPDSGAKCNRSTSAIP